MRSSVFETVALCQARVLQIEPAVLVPMTFLRIQKQIDSTFFFSFPPRILTLADLYCYCCSDTPQRSQVGNAMIHVACLHEKNEHVPHRLFTYHLVFTYQKIHFNYHREPVADESLYPVLFSYSFALSHPDTASLLGIDHMADKLIYYQVVFSYSSSVLEINRGSVL